MKMSDFIAENSAAIDAVIIRANGRAARLTDEERELWVLNDEGLYKLALAANVDDLA